MDHNESLRRRRCRIPLRACALLCLGLVAAAGRAQAPLEAYGRLPSIEEVALSMDGSKLALVRTARDDRLLSIVSLDDDKVLGGLRIGEQKLRGIEWADDDHVLYTTASARMPFELIGARNEWRLMQVYDVATKKPHALLDNVRTDAKVMNVVYGPPVAHRNGKDTLLYLHGIFASDQTQAALFRVDLTSAAESIVRQGGDATQAWLVDDNGEIVAEQDYYAAQRRWEIRLIKDHRTRRTVSGIAPIEYPSMLGLSADGAAAIVAVPGEGGTVWKRLSLEEGTWGEDIAPDDPATEFITDTGSVRMIGLGYVGDETRYRFVDPELQRRWDWIERVFWKERVEYVGASANHSRFLVRVLGPKSGYGYYFADSAEHITRRVGRIYPDVPEIAEVRKITYAAADGRKIPAYLTLPPGRTQKNLPIVVFPHGGPQARDHLGFDWWAQAMAAQGYAVLQPNYRGSELDQRWVEAGYGEWGRKMQTDLSDGLAYLAQQGIVDAKRACIVGASYGGYAALAGAALQPGLYRCAVAVAGISDPASMLRSERANGPTAENVSLRYWDRFMGVSGPDDKRLDEISPLKHVDQVAAPVLLIHGREDTTVPYDQSADMAKALKRAGKPVEFVTLDREDHYLSRSATRLQMLTASVAFLRKYNPPD